MLLLLLLILKIIKKDRQGTSLFTKVGDHSTRSSDSLLDLSISIQFRETAPGSQVLTAIDHDDRHLTLGAKSADKFLIFFILAVFGKTAETGRTTVERLGTFMEPFTESIVNEGLFENLG